MEKRILALVMAISLAIVMMPCGGAEETATLAEEAAVETAEILGEEVGETPAVAEEIVEAPAEEPVTEEAVETLVEEPVAEEAVEIPAEEPAAEEVVETPAEEPVAEAVPAEEPAAEPEAALEEQDAVGETPATVADTIAAKGAAYVRTSRGATQVFSGANMYKRELIGTIQGGAILYATSRVETEDDVAVAVAFADEEGNIYRGYVNEKDLAQTPLTEGEAKKAIQSEILLGGGQPIDQVVFELPAAELEEVTGEVSEEPAEVEEVTEEAAEEPAAVEEVTEETAEEPAEVEEATEEVTEEPAAVEEVTEETAEEPAEVEEATEEVTEEPAVVEEVTEEIAEEPAVVEEVTEEIAEEPAVVEEATDEVTEEPAVVEEATDEVTEEPAEVEEATEEPAVEPEVVERAPVAYQASLITPEKGFLVDGDVIILTLELLNASPDEVEITWMYSEDNWQTSVILPDCNKTVYEYIVHGGEAARRWNVVVEWVEVESK